MVSTETGASRKIQSRLPSSEMQAEVEEESVPQKQSTSAKAAGIMPLICGGSWLSTAEISPPLTKA